MSTQDNPSTPKDDAEHEMLPGGVHRVTFGRATARDRQTDADANAMEVYDRKPATIRQHTVVRVNMADMPAPSEDPILRTARTPHGSVSTKFADTDLIKVQGMEVQIRTALRTGLLIRDANGQLRSTAEARGEAEPQPGKPTPGRAGEQSVAQVQPHQSEAEPVEPEPFTSVEDLQAVREAATVISGEVLERATKTLAAFIVSGKKEADMRYLAEEAGIPAEQFAPAFESLYSAYYRQAAAHVERELGGMPFAFAADIWQQSDPKGLAEAMRQLVATQSPTHAFRHLVSRMKQVIAQGPVGDDSPASKPYADPYLDELLPYAGEVRTRRDWHAVGFTWF